MTTNEKGHSEEYFGNKRDYWYNSDFLDLMAKRWQLSKYNSLLDVGAGRCHWAKLIAPYLKENAKVVALDNDKKWVNESSNQKPFFEERKIDFYYLESKADDLPFEDNSFEVVTCQTLLIHVPNPEEVLKEMKRVLKPNGIIICAEPNNRIQFLLKDYFTQELDTIEILKNVKHVLEYEKERINVSLGDDSYGDLLTYKMNQLGFSSIQSYLNDKLTPLYPNYDKQEQKETVLELLAMELELADDLDDIQKKYFQSLRGDYDTYIKELNKIKYQSEFFNAIQSKKFFSSGVELTYLISATKLSK